MTEYYIEIEEEKTEENSYKPPAIFRQYVKDIPEAEKIYTEQKDLFATHKAKFVEMNHNKDPKLNKPCIEREIENGKVV